MNHLKNTVHTASFLSLFSAIFMISPHAMAQQADINHSGGIKTLTHVFDEACVDRNIRKSGDIETSPVPSRTYQAVYHNVRFLVTDEPERHACHVDVSTPSGFSTIMPVRADINIRIRGTGRGVLMSPAMEMKSKDYDAKYVYYGITDQNPVGERKPEAIWYMSFMKRNDEQVFSPQWLHEGNDNSQETVVSLGIISP